MPEDVLSKDEQCEVYCLIVDREEEGLVRLLRAYATPISRLLRRRFKGVLNEHDIEAVVFKAAQKAWDSIDTFADSHNLGGWFFTIALNTARDRLRQGTNKPQEHSFDDLNYEPVARSTDAIDDEADHAPPPLPEHIKDLLEVIAEMGPMQRTIIEADKEAGGEADTDFLADRLGIPKERVYTYRNKAHESFKKRMAKRGHTAETLGRRK